MFREGSEIRFDQRPRIWRPLGVRLPHTKSEAHPPGFRSHFPPPGPLPKGRFSEKFRKSTLPEGDFRRNSENPPWRRLRRRPPGRSAPRGRGDFPNFSENRPLGRGDFRNCSENRPWGRGPGGGKLLAKPGGLGPLFGWGSCNPTQIPTPLGTLAGRLSPPRLSRF